MARVSNIIWALTDSVRDPFSVDTARASAAAAASRLR
jgi:hypothetical protein